MDNLKKIERIENGKICVWFCENYDSFHLKAGSEVLTFNREEFSDFVDETRSCFYEREEDFLALN